MEANQTTITNFFSVVEDYIKGNIAIQNSNVVNYKSPHELKNILNLTIEQIGCDSVELISHIKDYLNYAVNTSDPQFFNQLYSGFNMPAFLGEVITALFNTSMYTFEVAPVATLMEQELIKKMCNVVGFCDGDGIFVTGGSNANLIAMFSARNKAFPDVKNKGLYGLPVLSMFISEKAHYSFVNNANVLGLGSSNVYKVKSDGLGKMIASDLELKIKASLEKGEKPFFVAGTAGTTMQGAFDPFVDIAEIAKKQDLWFHVDGSFGGSLILSDNNKSLFEGVNLADSFAWNPHKLMNIPLVCSVILVKDKLALYKNLTDINDDYIYHDTEGSSCDLGKKSIQCGRRVDSLKLWLAWKYYGNAGYAARMDKLISLADYFQQKVINDPYLELFAERQSVTVCFRYITKNKENIEKQNLEIREELRLKGISMVNFGYLDSKFVFRWVISNPDVTEEDINSFFESFNGIIKAKY